MDREAWHAEIHEVAKSRTWLSKWTELNWYIYSTYNKILFIHFILCVSYIKNCIDFLKAVCFFLFSLPFFSYLGIIVCVLLSHLGHVQPFVILWTVARQAALSMGFSRQEYWNQLPFPFPGDLSDSGIEPASLTSLVLADGFFTTSANWETPKYNWCFIKLQWINGFNTSKINVLKITLPEILIFPLICLFWYSWVVFTVFLSRWETRILSKANLPFKEQFN